jgi:hypothetical protein
MLWSLAVVRRQGCRDVRVKPCDALWTPHVVARFGSARRLNATSRQSKSTTHNGAMIITTARLWCCQAFAITCLVLAIAPPACSDAACAHSARVPDTDASTCKMFWSHSFPKTWRMAQGWTNCRSAPTVVPIRCHTGTSSYPELARRLHNRSTAVAHHCFALLPRSRASTPETSNGCFDADMHLIHAWYGAPVNVVVSAFTMMTGPDAGSPATASSSFPPTSFSCHARTSTTRTDGQLVNPCFKKRRRMHWAGVNGTRSLESAAVDADVDGARGSAAVIANSTVICIV